MKKTPQTEVIINNVISLRTPATNAMRLLEKLKSPFLFLASELLSPNSKPHNPVSQQSRHIDKEIECLSGSRLALSDTCLSKTKDQEATQHRKHPTHSMGNCFEPDTIPSRWFQKRKRAAKEIRDLSQSQLVLSPNQHYYHGDDRSHLCIHIQCGCTLKVALSELRTDGPKICPLCDGGWLSRISRIDRDHLYDYFLSISKGQVVLIKNQILGHSSEHHTFYHLGCRQPFTATADYVIRQNREGLGSGCNHCEKT